MAESDRPLRIAHLSFSSLPGTVGGLEVVVDSLIRTQMGAGHDVALITRLRQWQAARAANFPYRVLPLPPKQKSSARPFYVVGPRWPVAAAALWYQWRNCFDLWHVHWLYPTGWMVHDVLEWLGVPMVITAHGADIQVEASSHYGFRQYERHDKRVRSLVSRAKVMTAPSASIESRFRELGVDMSRVHRISNGVDVQRFRSQPTDVAAIRRRFGVGADTSLILTVGRDQPSKGLQFIPEALARLKCSGRRVIWVVVGNDSAAFREFAGGWGVVEELRLLPEIAGDARHEPSFPPRDLIDLYKAADVFAFPSLMESFGMVVIEAMAAGAPVVATDIPGVRDLIDHGINGLLCRPGDPASMADAIARVLDDAALARDLVSAGGATSLEHDWPRISARYLDLYRATIAQAMR